MAQRVQIRADNLHRLSFPQPISRRKTGIATLACLTLALPHGPCRRMPLEELPGSVVEFKREVYTEVAKEFGPLIQQLRLAGWQVDEQR